MAAVSASEVRTPSSLGALLLQRPVAMLAWQKLWVLMPVLVASFTSLLQKDAVSNEVQQLVAQAAQLNSQLDAHIRLNARVQEAASESYASEEPRWRKQARQRRREEKKKQPVKVYNLADKYAGMDQEAIERDVYKDTYSIDKDGYRVDNEDEPVEVK